MSATPASETFCPELAPWEEWRSPVKGMKVRARGTPPTPRGRRVGSYRHRVKSGELMRDIRAVLLRMRPTLAEESPETLLRLSYRAWMPAMGAARHDADPGFCYFPARALEADFGRGKFKRLNTKHNIFEELDADTRPGRWTRGYRLTPDLDSAINEYVRRIDERLPVLIMRNGTPVRRLPGAIASENRDRKASKAWAGAKVPNRVPVDFHLLHAWAEHMTRYVKTGGYMVAGAFVPFTPEDLEAVRYRRRVLSRLVGLANNTVCERKYVPIRYQEEPCGRAFATGVNLQSAPSEIREAALHGCWDLDISNCHYSLLLQLASAVGVEDLPEVRWYLMRKRNVREGLATRVGIIEDAAKACLIALIYGARKSLHKESEVVKLIGRERARVLYTDQQFRALQGDVTRARRAILRALKAGPLCVTTGAGERLRVAEIKKLTEERLFNAVGNSVTTRETDGRRKGKLRSPAKLLAHILLGLEAKIMRTIVDAHPSEVLLLMHDGLIARSELPRTELESLVLRQTGLRISLEQEQIEMPEELRELRGDFGTPPGHETLQFAGNPHNRCTL